jgi:hypothetical protein
VAYVTEKFYMCGKCVFVIENWLNTNIRMVLTMKFSFKYTDATVFTQDNTNSYLRKLFHEADKGVQI